MEVDLGGGMSQDINRYSRVMAEVPAEAEDGNARTVGRGDVFCRGLGCR